MDPILPGFYPDPSICRVDDTFYLVTSSFEYFPGVPIFRSTDLAHWQQIGHCLTRPSQLDLTHITSDNVFSSTPGFDRGIYAPTLRYHDGWFYMVTTNVNHNQHFWVRTQNPANEWSEPIIVQHEDIGATIDPSLLFDDDGTVYLTCRSVKYDAIVQWEVDINTGQQRSSIHTIWTDIFGKNAEGPHLYNIDGTYYLLVAEGGTQYGHLIAAGRSNSPYGPFEPSPHNPILTHRSQEHSVQSTGHGDIIEDANGNWWCVCLGVRPVGYPMAHHIGRETFIAPVTWDDDGWFTIGDNGMLPPLADKQTVLDLHDDFDRDTLDFAWNFLRVPPVGAWSLTERPGFLRLWGLPAALDDTDIAKPLTLIGRRQQHHTCTVTTELHFDPASSNEVAGMTVRMNARHHYSIAVHADQIIVIQRIGELVAYVGNAKRAAGKPVWLQIEAGPAWYTCRYSLNGERFTDITRGEVRYLSTEVAGGFVGVYFGLYATGAGTTSTSPADFAWFAYNSS
jgi:xylan 1,4-beta-xylosidase